MTNTSGMPLVTSIPAKRPTSSLVAAVDLSINARPIAYLCKSKSSALAQPRIPTSCIPTIQRPGMGPYWANHQVRDTR